MGEKTNRYIRKLLYWRPTRNLLHILRHIKLPGFQGVPMFDVLYFFFSGFFRGYVNQRASALTFHFLLAIIPLLLFFFTLLPYIPIGSVYPQILDLVGAFVPDAISDKMIESINDILFQKHQGIMSIGFISSLYIASSGFFAIMTSFDNSAHIKGRRSWIKKRLMSIVLVFASGIIILISFVLIMGSKEFFKTLLENGILERGSVLFLLKTSKWILLIALVYMMFVLIFHYAPSNSLHFKFFSAGATLATILFILSTYGFNFYIIHFSRYNVLYGSLGAIIILFLWFYMISYILIICFELNASIAHALINRKELEKPFHKRNIRIFRKNNKKQELIT
ncbi:MAG: YihY/virulence factor BrkB family protein [Bacteroidales bacterium]|jgi:membrane protein|nr:YihY/virulence factor BrkB family protein [Bacteroidales bacterium]